jgi:rRNA maturation endonuclease Nob1
MSALDKGKAKHMVVDANALIKMKGSQLYHKAENFWTVEAVKNEIRDSKAREHLNQLPFELISRQPSAEAMSAVAQFARKTGDFRELSLPDLEILALTYMLESETNGIEHLRTEPKRSITGARVKAAGKDVAMASVNDKKGDDAPVEGEVAKAAAATKAVPARKAAPPAKPWSGWATPAVTPKAKVAEAAAVEAVAATFEALEVTAEVAAEVVSVEAEAVEAEAGGAEAVEAVEAVAVEAVAVEATGVEVVTTEAAEDVYECENECGFKGCYEDVEAHEEGCSHTPGPASSYEVQDDGEDEDEDSSPDSFVEAAAFDGQREGFVFKMGRRGLGYYQDNGRWTQVTYDPAEAARMLEAQGLGFAEGSGVRWRSDASHLQSEEGIEYEYEDDDEEGGAMPDFDDGEWEDYTEKEVEFVVPEQHRLPENMTWSANGGLVAKEVDNFEELNIEEAFPAMPDLGDGPCTIPAIPEGCFHAGDERTRLQTWGENVPGQKVVEETVAEVKVVDAGSRILSMGMSSDLQSTSTFEAGDEEDDGVGWINPTNFDQHTDNWATAAKDSWGEKAAPTDAAATTAAAGASGAEAGAVAVAAAAPKPPAASPPVPTVVCITTDFAMQNVLLQMGLKLLSHDGMLVKRLKQWCLRCAACFTVTFDMDKMFCHKCGNACLERIACSVHKSGHYKLHFRKKNRRGPNLMGTKFSIPKMKAKTGKDRFIGTEILREDQMMMGLWDQRLRKKEKVVESMFGADISLKVGVSVKQRKDVKIGFGRQNRNAMKGRERRGKKNVKH